MAGDELKCPECGAKVYATDNRCMSCGAEFDPSILGIPSPEVATREGEVEPEGIEPEPPARRKPQAGPSCSSLMLTAAPTEVVQLALVFGALVVALWALSRWGLSLWAFAFVLVGLEALVVGLVLGVQRLVSRRERDGEPEQLQLFTPAPGRASATVPRTPPPSRSVPQPSTAAVRRPVVVTIVAIVFGLPAILPVGVTFVAFATGYPWMFLEGLGSLEMVLVFGVLVLVCLGILKAANSLYNGADWARRVFMVLLVLLALGGVYLVLVAESKGLPALGIAFCVLFIVMLNGRGVREYCTR